MEIRIRYQVEEAFLQWVVGIVSAPLVINRRELAGIHEASELQGWIAWKSGSGFLVNRPYTHARHD
jgi:hypothetical protein